MKSSRIVAAFLLACAPLALAAAHESDAQPPSAGAPVPKEQLLVPTADAVHYVVVSDAGKHGDMWSWTLPDGRMAYRHSQSLRGWITETDQVVTLAGGMPVKVEVRGITPSGDAAETFSLAGNKAVWKSTADSGAVAGPTATICLPAASGSPMPF